MQAAIILNAPRLRAAPGLRQPRESETAHRIADLEMLLELSRQEAAAANAALEQASQASRDAQLMLREVDHRAKNSLQLAASILQLQGMQAGDAVTKDLFRAAAQRLQSLAAMHAQLYRSGSGGVCMSQWLQQVCGGLSSPPAIEIVVEAPNVVWPVSIAAPVGLLTAEAVANALKHAFVAPPGRISVRLAEEGGGWLIHISDNGCGGEISEGLGFQLLRLFAQQLGGELDVGPGPGGRGLAVTVRFCRPA